MRASASYYRLFPGRTTEVADLGHKSARESAPVKKEEAILFISFSMRSVGFD
jgi:hypothetical protein